MRSTKILYPLDIDMDDSEVDQHKDTWKFIKKHLNDSGGNSLFPVGGQSLLNFRQNFQISDVPPPPFALEKTVFSPLLGQNFLKFVNFPFGAGGGGGCPPRPTKISTTAE